jgi:hypothetical protein
VLSEGNMAGAQALVRREFAREKSNLCRDNAKYDSADSKSDPIRFVFMRDGTGKKGVHNGTTLFTD